MDCNHELVLIRTIPFLRKGDRWVVIERLCGRCGDQSGQEQLVYS